nr:reductive dehalogenase [uncultured bacterium]
MSKFHSTVSRRDFMKTLGLAGAGLGAAAALSPVFHDIDEVVASPTAENKRPWWIKNRELGDTTLEVDWDMMVRPDGRVSGQQTETQVHYLGQEEVTRRLSSNILSPNIEDAKNNKPGNTLRDQALGFSSIVPMLIHPTDFMGPQMRPTPAMTGAPKWQGTPEENSRMVRSALTFFGAGMVGFGEVSKQEREKLFYTYHKQVPNKQQVFEDVDLGYEDADKYVFPNKPLYRISMTLPMSREMYRTSDRSQLQFASNVSRYRHFSMLQPAFQEFIRGIGYQCYGYPAPVAGPMPAAASAILSGLAEASRNSGYCIDPEYGPVSGFFTLITDLPLEPTPPIDAGIWRFCQTCNKCAENCPNQVIPYDHEPSWEPPTFYGKPDIMHPLGKRMFYTDHVGCWMYCFEGGCGACMATCTFNVNGSAMVHDAVKATLATTPILNGFLWQADKTFGYGLKSEEEKEEWWDLSLPSMGWDTASFSKHGGY